MKQVSDSDTVLNRAFEMYKAIFSQNKKVLLYVSIITVFHIKMLLQAGAEIKPAMFTLERSDYLHCPKHLLGFHGISSQTHTSDIISRDHQTPPNSKTLSTRTILMLLPPEILSPMHHETYCI